jgi:class 3 adenylate cyclase/tetratricopeptide (TPR) repeat protein
MKCPACAHDNAASTKFCGECGARLQAVCPACRAANPPGNKFCGECGAALAAAPPAPPPETEAAPVAPRYAAPHAYTPKHLADKILSSKSAIEGERKQVTVLFTDVSGFTAMSEKLDPEDVHGIMDRTFEVILGAVHHYEGTINQFLGDGVMALFGAPIAHEDHAHRALGAALAIQERLEPVREDVLATYGVEFRLRVGVNTGPVVVGAIGRDLRMDYTAVGDTTNLAARMLSVAEPGQIATTDHTHRLTQGFFEFDDLGEFNLKGKRKPVRGWAVTRELRGRTRLEVSRERGLTPLAGRDNELAVLAAAYARAVKGRAAVLLVTGEPGAGKSRVLYEFLRTLDESAHHLVDATCVSYGRSVPYHPVVGLLRRDLQLAESATDEHVRGAAGSRLRALGLEAGEEPVTLLAHVLGVPASEDFLTRLGAQVKERTLALLGDLFVAMTASRPLVLIVEDVHWIDPSSEEFLKHLIPRLAGHPALLLLTARPDVEAAWPPPAVELLTIEGLAGDHARAMIQVLTRADRVSDELVNVLLTKSEGNPLYVEEILRQLEETGGLALEDGEARLSRSDVTVPETIHDIIAARVDRLEDTLKHTLQGAAVVGHQFATPLLSRLFDRDEPRVAGHLRSLQELDFVFLLAQVMYSFKHALTQEVVYTGLLERRRRLYHAVVGAGLEELYADRLEDVAELLAHHYGCSAEQEKAVDYAIIAGEKAQRQWATAEALAHFDSALKRLESMPDTEGNRLRRIDAVVKQAEIKFVLGRHAEHIRALEAIRPLVDETADPPRRAAWYCWTGFLHSLTGTPPDITIAFCQEALAIAEAAGLEEIRAMADCCLCHVYAYAGRLRDAFDAGHRALPIFEARGNVWWACRTLWGLSLTAIPLGLWSRSLDYCERALAHGEAVNDRRLKVVGWWRTGWTHIQQGNAGTGVACCENALALSPGPFDTAMARAARGYGLVKTGYPAVGIAELTEAVTWFGASKLPFTRAWFALWLADAYLLLGERAKARPIAEDVLDVSRDAGYHYFEGIAERVLGASLVEETLPEAERHLTVALEILEEMGARNEVAKALMGRAEVSRRAGDVAGARDWLAQALAIFEELGTLDELPRVHAMMAALG